MLSVWRDIASIGQQNKYIVYLKERFSALSVELFALQYLEVPGLNSESSSIQFCRSDPSIISVDWLLSWTELHEYENKGEMLHAKWCTEVNKQVVIAYVQR